MEPITEFQGEYRFLSNFWPAKVNLGGEVFPTVEHAYQASKCHDLLQFLMFLSVETPGEAKRLGRKIKVREDWDEVKVDIMRALVMQKFDNDPDLADKLLATGERELIEGNKWGDTFWGVCNGQGENHLGRILMEVREWLKVR